MDTPKHNYCRKARCFFFPLLFVGLFAISALVMLLWNLIIPEIAHLPAINYWQAMGLFILCRILFGSFSFRRHHPHHLHFGHPHFKDRFMEMNDDEKLQFKNQWKSRCCKNT